MIFIHPASLVTLIPKDVPKMSPTLEVAIRALRELVISLMFGAMCCAFTATPALLWGGIIIQCIVNTAIRIILAANGRPLDNWLTALGVSLGSLHNPQILIHETGHVAAVEGLLQNGNPKIELFPYFGGSTSFQVSKPTELGKKLGVERIQPIIAASGPILSLAVSTVQLGVSLKLSHHAPELSRMLVLASLVNFLFHFVYAVSAIWANPKNCANDFVVLKAAGIHPLFAALAILAIPFTIFKGHT
jgi:hypothetical protein